MYELDREQFSIVLPLLKPIHNKAVYALSVMDHIQRGRIYVNNIAEPTAAFITSSGGFYCLTGTVQDRKFNDCIIDYMNKPSNHNHFYALGIFSDEWEKEIDNRPIKNAKKILRSYFRFNQDRFLSEHSHTSIGLDPHFKQQSLNLTLSKLYREGFYPYYQMVWDSDAHFCTHGIGHFITSEEGILSVCTSPYISKKFAEIDIITVENYKRMGLATAAGVGFIRECLSKQLTPNWCCHSDNRESNQLASKLGFDKVNEHPMYWYHD